MKSQTIGTTGLPARGRRASRVMHRTATLCLGVVCFAAAPSAVLAVERTHIMGIDTGRLEVRIDRTKSAVEGVTVEGSTNGTTWTQTWPLTSYTAGASGSPDNYRLRDPNTATSSVPRWVRVQPRTPAGADTTGKFTNISARAPVSPGNGVMIFGFVIEGGTVQVLARGVGPTLTGFGVPGALPDPTMTVFQGSSPLSTNDDWGGTTALKDAFARVWAFSFASDASLDSALLPQLAAGAYTLQISPAAKTPTTTGEAMGEVYHDPYLATNGKLVNLSIRTTGGSSTLITGLYLDGSRPRSVLIRAVGPTLGAFGVSGVLTDPRLTVYRGSTVVASNDDWGSPVDGMGPIVQAAARVWAFSLQAGSKDAAIVTTLEPGATTMHVTGATTDPGIVLIEVYDLGAPVLP